MVRVHSSRRGWAFAGLACLVAGGCGGDPHAQVVRDQTAALKEMSAILKEIKDDPSLEKARGRLLARLDQYQGVADRGKALGPPPSGFAEKNSQLVRDLQEAVSQYVAEIKRVQTLKLAGADDFLAEFRQPKSTTISSP